MDQQFILTANKMTVKQHLKGDFTVFFLTFHKAKTCQRQSKRPHLHLSFVSRFNPHTFLYTQPIYMCLCWSDHACKSGSVLLQSKRRRLEKTQKGHFNMAVSQFANSCTRALDSVEFTMADIPGASFKYSFLLKHNCSITRRKQRLNMLFERPKNW